MHIDMTLQLFSKEAMIKFCSRLGKFYLSFFPITNLGDYKTDPAEKQHRTFLNAVMLVAVPLSRKAGSKIAQRPSISQLFRHLL